MKPMIELNRLSVLIDQEALAAQPKAVILMKGEIPVLKTPFKLGLVDITWETKGNNQLPEKWSIKLAGEMIDSDWVLRSKLELISKLQWRHEIVRWDGDSPLEGFQLHLSDESQFFVDEHEVDLSSTINRFLTQKESISNIFGNTRLNALLEQMAKKYFGSDNINDLLTDLFYLIEGDFERDKGKATLSAAYNLEHFSEKEEAPPYCFFKIPTADIEYFISHFSWPAMELKGYELVLKSLEVTGDNRLIISINELDHGWDIILDIKLDLRDNTLYPEVKNIKVEGLDFLKKTLFKVFKGLLIRQIENRPVPVIEMYREFKSDFEMKYPFLQIQPGLSPFLDAFSLNKEKTEIMVHFAQPDLST